MSNLIGNLKLGTFWGLILRGGVGLLSIGVGAILARMLSVEELGFFFLALSLIRFFSILSGFGLPEGVQKIIGIANENGNWAQVKDSTKKISYLFLLSSIFVGVFFAILRPVLSTRLFDNELSFSLGLIVLAIFLLRGFEFVGAAFLRAVKKPILGMFFVGTPKELLFAIFLIAIWLFYGKLDIEGVLIVYLVASIIIAMALFSLIFKHFSNHTETLPHESGLSLRNYISLSIPIVLYGSLVTFFNSADIWILGIYRGAEEVSLYGAAFRVVLLVPFALQVLNMILPTMVAALYHKGEKRKLTFLARTAATWSFLFGSAVTLIFMIFGNGILSGIYGPDFADGWGILTVLAMGQLVNAACGSPGVILQMTGFHRLLTKITIVTTVLNIVGNLAVVEAYGAIGVAMITMLSLIFQNAATTYYVYSKIGILTLPHPGMLKPRYLRQLFRT